MSKYIRIAVSVLLLGIIAWRTDWSEVTSAFVSLRVELWLAAVGVLLVAQVASARRWQLFAQKLNFKRTLPQYCAYYLIGMYFNLSLPTSVGGDVVRVWFLDNHSGRKWAALASVALDRLNGLLVLIAVACVGVLMSPIPLEGWITTAVWSIAACATAGMISLPILQRWQMLPEQRRRQLETVIRLMRVPSGTIWATCMSILVQVIGVLSLWFIGMGLGLEIPFAYYCILGPMVALLTLLPISFNGMGLRELGMVVFLAPLDVNKGTATTLALLWFAVSAAVSLMGGLVYLLGAYPKAGSASQSAQEGADDDGSVDRDSDQGREGQHQKAA